MGLDQYAYAVRPNPMNTDFAFEQEVNGEKSYHEIAYWRKHSNLQGYMERLYLRKATEQGFDNGIKGWGGETNCFNCQPVRLTFQDLAELETAVKGKALPHTTGFFFGESQPEDKKDDLAFIKAARKAMSQDMEIYYDSWW